MTVTYDLSPAWIVGLTLLVVWELSWKGVALWQAARNGQLGWYVPILILNTAGILPIIYLLIQRASRAAPPPAPA